MIRKYMMPKMRVIIKRGCEIIVPIPDAGGPPAEGCAYAVPMKVPNENMSFLRAGRRRLPDGVKASAELFPLSLENGRANIPYQPLIIRYIV
jgi:hypothetical protein